MAFEKISIRFTEGIFLSFPVDAESIRDVIAFPKTTTAQCPLTDAPSEIGEAQLNELHIAVKPRSD